MLNFKVTESKIDMQQKKKIIFNVLSLFLESLNKVQLFIANINNENYV